MTSDVDGAGPIGRSARSVGRPSDPSPVWILYAFGVLLVAQFVAPVLVAAIIVAVANPANGKEAYTEAGIIATPLIGILLAAGSLWAVRQMGYSRDVTGWRWRGLHMEATNIAWGVFVALAMLAFEFLFDLVVRALGFRLDPLAPYQSALKSPVLVVFLVVTAIVTAPLGEEVFYRGFLLGMLTLRRRGGAARFAAIAAVAFFWALLHLNPAAFVQLTVFGIALGYLRTRQDGLVGAVTAHTVNNMVTIVVLLLIHYLGG